ncbi:hypothetical protein [Dysgonomonas sp. 520]|uniref:hypothetical protein n=1 Tax=Dysgonomonas sp. 520 TaxID=2302931 RepID=UPI0013D8C0F2|nr:hypothetical protein [Dysgonomonas sp. 520]NDW08152.1 hypothetical protein [Dysgonomonas sp. 520]
MKKAEQIDTDILAVIAMALYDIEDEVHDVEAKVLTIKRQSQEYLPWSSKEFGLRQLPTRK